MRAARPELRAGQRLGLRLGISRTQSAHKAATTIERFDYCPTFTADSLSLSCLHIRVPVLGQSLVLVLVRSAWFAGRLIVVMGSLYCRSELARLSSFLSLARARETSFLFPLEQKERK